jgi:segregation and condensation protein B
LADEPEIKQYDEPLDGRTAPAEPGDLEALDPELPIPRGAEVEAVLEALLFATTQPLNVKRLSVLMNGVPEEEIQQALGGLQERYQGEACGLALMEVAGGWQVATRPEVADWVLRLHKHRRRQALSPSLLETLAIVAYKQPITRAEIEAIRGVDCGSALRSIQDAGLCEIVGRKDTLGKPPIYGTTELFLKTFGLKDLEQLPSVGELKRVLQAPMKTEEPASTEESDQSEISGNTPQAAE